MTLLRIGVVTLLISVASACSSSGGPSVNARADSSQPSRPIPSPIASTVSADQVKANFCSDVSRLNTLLKSVQTQTAGDVSAVMIEIGLMPVKLNADADGYEATGDQTLPALIRQLSDKLLTMNRALVDAVKSPNAQTKAKYLHEYTSFHTAFVGPMMLCGLLK